MLIGCYPRLLYDLLPFATDYTAYDTTHVLAQLQILFFSALAFAWLKLSGLYPPELPSVNIDVEWIYRRLGWRAALVVRSGARAVHAGVGGALVRAGRGVGEWARRSFGPGGRLAEAWGHEPDGDRDDCGAVRVPGVSLNAAKPCTSPGERASRPPGSEARNGRPAEGPQLFKRAGRPALPGTVASSGVRRGRAGAAGACHRT